MKIERKPCPAPFGKLVAGDVFESVGVIYLKIHKQGHLNAVELDHGLMCGLDACALVVPLPTAVLEIR